MQEALHETHTGSHVDMDSYQCIYAWTNVCLRNVLCTFCYHSECCLW